MVLLNKRIKMIYTNDHFYIFCSCQSTQTTNTHLKFVIDFLYIVDNNTVLIKTPWRTFENFIQ